MGKLSDMRVGRVDGVDKPAIRKRWVVVKSEDAPETVEKDYAGAARAVIEAIAKEGVSFSDETVEVLRALVDLLEIDVEFAAKAEESADEDETDDEDGEAEGDSDAADEGDTEGEGDADADADAEGDVEKTHSADEVEAIVEKALRAAGVNPETVTKSSGDTDGTAPLRVAKSKQPREGDEGQTVRKGTGLFANIVHGKATEPYGRR